MGCLGSKYGDLPVVAHPFGLKVLPGCEKYYKTESSTQLVLKEKFWSLSGDSCSVKDENGKVWFRIKGQALSLHGESTLLDANQKPIAVYRRKTLSLTCQAYLTVEKNDQKLVYATIKRDSRWCRAAAAVFIHKPPVPLDRISTNGLVPDLFAEGDIVGKDYGLILKSYGRDRTNLKVAQITKKYKWFAANDTYYINAGAKTDVSLIVMIAFAIDELFHDNGDAGD